MDPTTDIPTHRIRNAPEDPHPESMPCGADPRVAPVIVIDGGPPKETGFGWILPIVVVAAHVAALGSLARLDIADAPVGASAMEFRLEPQASEFAPDAAPAPIATTKSASGSPASPGIPRRESRDPPMASSPLPEPTAMASAAASAAEPSIGPTDSGESSMPSATEAGMDAPPSQDGSAPGGEGASSGSEYLRNPMPEYPVVSRFLGEEGRVELLVVVDTSGGPVSVHVVQTSRHPRLDGAALRAVWSWAFHPAIRKGRPVVASVVVPIRFSLANP